MSSDSKPRAPRRSPRPAGIREIAEALGVSIGTVDRALHNRPGISPITRRKVMSMADTLGYRPNLAARFLSSRRELRIGVVLPREIASFFDFVREGVREAARPFEPTGTRVFFASYPRLGEGETEAVEAALQNDIQGLIISPGDPQQVRGVIRAAARRQIPVMCVATDAPGTERLAAVSVDPYVNGSIAAELMGRFLAGPGGVVAFTGQLATVDHKQKLRGFRETLAALSPCVEVIETVETHDNELEAYAKAIEVLQSRPGIRGVYVSTANSIPVLNALRDLGLAGATTVITTDLFPKLAEIIREGGVAATIHQRPLTQGQMAFQALHRFLVEGICPTATIRLVPHIVMRSNLVLFMDRFRIEPEQEWSETFAASGAAAST